MTHPVNPSSSAATHPSSPSPAFEQLLGRVKEKVERAGVFGTVTIRDGRLVCPARAAAAAAAFRLEMDQRGTLWVALVTADRWLSQSIEQDLVHTGDKLPDLLEEELTDLATSFPAAQHPYPAPPAAPVPPIFEHFRSEDLLFTFRSPLPEAPLESDVCAETAALWLLAYEATFRNLGDMEVGEDE